MDTTKMNSQIYAKNMKVLISIIIVFYVLKIPMMTDVYLSKLENIKALPFLFKVTLIYMNLALKEFSVKPIIFADII
jgi:hypothetical protein